MGVESKVHPEIPTEVTVTKPRPTQVRNNPGEVSKSPRAQQLKKQREHDLRSKIQNSGQLKGALDTLQKLDDVYNEIHKIPISKFTRQHQAKYMTMIAALKTKMDAHFRFLAKVVPDLKSVELGDPEGKAPQLRLTLVAPDGSESSIT